MEKSISKPQLDDCSTISVIVVIPTYNEVENLSGLCNTLFSLPIDLEILVIDDNSPDGTGELARELSIQEDRFNVIHRSGKLGLGTAYTEGLTWALNNSKADIIAQMDADFSHDPYALPLLIQVSTKGAIAVGSRYTAGGDLEGLGSWRRFLSAAANMYIRALLGLSVRDATGAFRCWPRRTLTGIDLSCIRSSGFAILPEMLVLASRQGFPITEVPIKFDARRGGQSKLTVKILVEWFFDVWNIRLRNFL